MSKKMLNSYDDFAKDYLEFVRILKQWKKVSRSSPSIYIDTKELDQISSKLAVPKNSFDWKVPKCTIVFREIDLGNKLRPLRINTPSKVLDKTVRLTVLSTGTSYDLTNICNPLATSQVDIVIEVEYRKDGTRKKAKAAWHLDKHSDSTNEETPAESEFSHPEYHFHFGGKNLMSDENFTLSGNLLLCGSPRIQYFPLDIILAVDFVIQNFYEKAKKDPLVKSSTYRKIIKRAKERLWRPYIYALANNIRMENEHGRFNDLNFTENIYNTFSGDY